MRVRRLTEREYLEKNWKKVRFIRETSRWFEYKIFKHTVWIYKDESKPHCTCEHGSLWGVNKPAELCRHIKLVRQAVIKRRSWKWDWWKKESQ